MLLVGGWLRRQRATCGRSRLTALRWPGDLWSKSADGAAWPGDVWSKSADGAAWPGDLWSKSADGAAMAGRLVIEGG
jgi:hypothetical protein